MVHGEPLLVIGAHYDVFSERGEFPGANDNASGTAALLELARVLRGRRLSRPVMLVSRRASPSPSDALRDAVTAVPIRS